MFRNRISDQSDTAKMRTGGAIYWDPLVLQAFLVGSRILGLYSNSEGMAQYVPPVPLNISVERVWPCDRRRYAQDRPHRIADGDLDGCATWKRIREAIEDKRIILKARNILIASVHLLH